MRFATPLTEKAPSPRPRGRGCTLIDAPESEKAPSPWGRGQGGTLVTPPRRGLGAFKCALCDASETGLGAF